MTDVLDEAESSGIDRRSALKKAALAAGAAAWASPVIQSLGADAASAAVTNCRVTVNFRMNETLSNCDALCTDLGNPPGCAANCCKGHTYFANVDAIDVSCGAGCPGTPVITSRFNITAIISGLGTLVSCNGVNIIDFGNCNSAGSTRVRIEGSVRCADGKTYSCNFVVDFNTGTCPPTLLGTYVSGGCS